MPLATHISPLFAFFMSKLTLLSVAHSGSSGCHSFCTSTRHCNSHCGQQRNLWTPRSDDPEPPLPEPRLARGPGPRASSSSRVRSSRSRGPCVAGLSDSIIFRNLYSSLHKQHLHSDRPDSKAMLRWAGETPLGAGSASRSGFAADDVAAAVAAQDDIPA